MGENRDFLDELIAINEDWQAVRSPLAGIANTLAAKPEEIPVWNPADYKERPRANTTMCTTCKAHNTSVCHRCVTVCPVNALDLEESQVAIDDTCRKCGLCVSACPSETFVAREVSARKLYDRIAGAAASHETAYVTCTRALGRLPHDNEVVLPCVGVVPSEVWFSIMLEYGNVSVYLPLGVCDKCRTTTGEEALGELIGRAEEWCGFGLNLEVDEAALTCEVRRSWARQKFIDDMTKSTERLLSKSNPVLNAAARVKRTLDAHRQKMDALSRSLDKAVGVTNSKRKRRTLIERRRLMMTTLQDHPELAKNILLYKPVVDPEKCTLCGECEKVCPTRTVEVTEDGRWHMDEAYCVQCDACAAVCPAGALTFEPCDASELVMPKEIAPSTKAQQEEQKAQVERLKEEGKGKLMQGLDALEKLAGALEDSDE